MTEELKIVADILKQVSGQTLWGVIAYLTYAYVKPITICIVAGVFGERIIKAICGCFKRPPANVVELDIKE